MEVKIIAFGIAKDILGTNEIELAFKESIAVEELLEELKTRYPAFRELRSLAIAINETYASPGQMIGARDEVVIIPPVAGG
jgi:molybdopterin synthase sulfur carrier subunit